MGTAIVQSTITRIGVGLVVLSCFLFCALFAVPFLPMDGASQVTVAGSLALTSEIMFWLGALIAGKEAITYLRKRFLPASWQGKASAS